MALCIFPSTNNVPSITNSEPSHVRSASPSKEDVPVQIANLLLTPDPVTEPLPVPAPISDLISAAVTPEANVGEPPPLNIPGSAKDVKPEGLVLLYGVNPNAPVTLALDKDNEPPNVKSPVPVTVPVNVSPLTVPVPLTDVTPALELVPAPIKFLTSTAEIFEFNDGVEPFDNIAGVPESVTLPLLVTIFAAWVDVIPTFPLLVVMLDAWVLVIPTLALLVVMFEAWVLVIPTLAVFAVIADAWPPLIVVVFPAIAVVEVVPITKLEVPLPVPAPIKFLTSTALILVFKLGVEPLLSIAGVPVSFTTPKLLLAPEAVLEPVPPLTTAKSVPDQSELLIESEPPNVKLPLLVTVPERVIPLTEPVVPTLVTVPCGMLKLVVKVPPSCCVNVSVLELEPELPNPVTILSYAEFDSNELPPDQVTVPPTVKAFEPPLNVNPASLVIFELLFQNATLVLEPEPVTFPTCELSIFVHVVLANTAQSPIAQSVIPSKFVLPATDTI